MNVEPKEIAAFLAAVIGGGFALWRWTVDQKWRRLQYAQSLIKEFFEKKSIARAFEVLDTIGEVEFEDESNPTKRLTINITNEVLIGAFTTFEQKKKNTYEEIVIRDIFDDLFDGISIFQSHIDIGLIKLRDIRPYLDYWIKELSGNGKVHGKKVARQISRYLTFFGYDQVLRFARDMGYPFKEHDPESSELAKQNFDDIPGRPRCPRAICAASWRAPSPLPTRLLRSRRISQTAPAPPRRISFTCVGATRKA